MDTKNEIVEATIPILAREGYAGTSMRKVASAINREPSVIYAHFTDKEDLLRATRQHITQKLDSTQHYSSGCTSKKLLYETVLFQLRNREPIVALLQYFMAMRQDFPLSSGGYVPERAYAHMSRVIELGISEHRYTGQDQAFAAKAATHLTNGFLMEYFDRKLSRHDTEQIASQLTDCIDNLLRKRTAG